MSEENSNFQLLNLRAQENPEIIKWLQKIDEKYPSPEIQNELLQAIALDMRQISANIQNATFFTITAAKTGDVSNKEQLVFAFGGLVTGLRYTKISLKCILWKEQMQIKY